MADKPRGRPSLTVGPQDRAVFGVPESCPVCGGHLGPAFGQTIDDHGRRHAVMDPNTAICRDCGTMVPVRQP